MDRNQYFLKAKKYLIRLWRSSPGISVKWLNLHGMSPGLSVYGKWYVERMQPCQAQWFKQIFDLCFWIYMRPNRMSLSEKPNRPKLVQVPQRRHRRQSQTRTRSPHVYDCEKNVHDGMRNEKLDWENRRLQYFSTLPAEIESSLGGEPEMAHLYQQHRWHSLVLRRCLSRHVFSTLLLDTDMLNSLRSSPKKEQPT